MNNLLAYNTSRRLGLECSCCGEILSKPENEFDSETPIIEFARWAEVLGFHMSDGEVYCTGCPTNE